MKRSVLILAGLFALLRSFTLPAESITRHDDPLVRELEGRFALFASATRHGDMVAFRALRTAEANKGIPPNATGEQLKQMAEIMAPDLAGYQFMQLETSNNDARIAYLHQASGEMGILVVMFEKEGGEWKVGNNHSQDYAGQVPQAAAALKEALSSPEVQFPK